MDDKEQAIFYQLRNIQATISTVSWQLGILIAVVVVALWRFW